MVKFYKCSICGNIAIKIVDHGVDLMCCHTEMDEIPLITDDNEKHSPIVTFNDNLMTVNVGQINHPMEKEHLIEWIYIEYSEGGEIIYLNDAPFISVNIFGRNVLNVYSYCNIHGLWKKEVKY